MRVVFWRWIALATAFFPALVNAQQPTVNVLTVVTSEALQFLGASSATNLATNEINKTNQALAASSVNLRVALAGVVQLNMPMPLTVLDSIKEAKKNLNILAARDATNADAVVVIHRTVATDGVALVTRATRAEDAFAAIHPAQTQGSAYGYPHELAHLFGATHQDTGGALSSVYTTGDTPGGQGYYFRHNLISLSLALTAGAANPLGGYCKHTVMTYPPKNILKGVDCTNAQSTPVLLFSNPNVCEIWYTVTTPVTSKSLCFGDSSHNNAAIVGQHGPTLMDFRAAKLRPRTMAERFQAVLGALGLTDPPPSCAPGC
jgi:Metallo-peptidase family M12